MTNDILMGCSGGCGSTCASSDGYLRKEKYLGEFETELDKHFARQNLGIPDEYSLQWGHITGFIDDQIDLIEKIQEISGEDKSDVLNELNTFKNQVNAQITQINANLANKIDVSREPYLLDSANHTYTNVEYPELATVKETLDLIIEGGIGGGGSGAGLVVVQNMEELLTKEELQHTGQLVYLIEEDDVVYYSASSIWSNINKVAIQDTEPEDKSVLWVDGDETTLGTIDSAELQALYDSIQALAQKVSTLEYMQTMISPGGFTNNVTTELLSRVDPLPYPGYEEGTRSILAAAEIDPEYPAFAEDWLPNTKHITIKSGSQTDLQANFDAFVDSELLWAKDTKQLYIKSAGSPVLLNTGTGSGGGIDYDALDRLDTIGFIAENGTRYRVKVNNNGELVVYLRSLDTAQTEPTGGQTDPNTGWVYVTTLYLQKLYINSIYCGGITSDEYSYNPCSHNFVELSNLTNNDISLYGLSLQYGTEGTSWQVLPLWGLIKAQSTFLIRGAQCSVITNTTRINVDTYDMEWRDSNGNLIKFDNTKAKFYLTWGDTASTVVNPYDNSTGTIRVSKGYIDLVGLQIENASDVNTIDAYENTSYKYLSSGRLFTKYYTMDPVSQATKALTARNNANDMYFVNLEADIIPRVESFTPKASFENKTLFFNKSLLVGTKPNLVTSSLGRNGTATNNDASRCFNWVSTGYYDEYLWYRQGTTGAFTQVESFKNETGVRKYYNRIRMISTDGTPFTTHKVILTGLSAGTYEYYVGRSEEYKSDTFTFTVRNTADVIADGWKFIQTTDQQGFNWDEYQVWKLSANYIMQNNTDLHFMINTGDMTQNGNRINEWIDYDDGRLAMADLEQMVTVGNNDLTPANVYVLGDGGDASKINATNMQFFYCYEFDETNPPVFELQGKEIFVESLYSFNYGNMHFLCVNSEIPAETERDVWGLSPQQVVYDRIKQWCIDDAAGIDTSLIKWRCAYCHEMPFTIITQDLINNYYWAGTEYPAVERSGSRLNFNTSPASAYWFSQFLQENNYRLVLGGHKHTYTCSYPILENNTGGTLETMKPIIQVTPQMLQDIWGDTELYTYTAADTDEPLLEGYSFPASWKGVASLEIQRHLCTFELVDNITAPIYLMSQATGYKHTSNKELPTPYTPWLRYFFPATVSWTSQTNISATVNPNQRYPFYIIFTVTGDNITCNVRKLSGIFDNSGKYNVNLQDNPNPTDIGGNGQTNEGNDLIIIE